MSELEHRPDASPAAPPARSAFLNNVKDAITVTRVFGDPIEHDGAVVIPAAYVGGGGGEGGGTQPDGAMGTGGGFGVKARPAGALVLRDGDVRWVPASDPERRLVIGATVAVVGILALRSLLGGRRRRRRR